MTACEKHYSIRNLSRQYSKGVVRRCSLKRSSEKFRKIQKKTPVFYCEFRKFSKNSFCYRTPPVAASTPKMELFAKIINFWKPNIAPSQMLGRVLDTPLKLENPSEVRLMRKRNPKSAHPNSSPTKIQKLCQVRVTLLISSACFNDTHMEKLCFIQFSTRMAGWLLLTFLICLHNQLSSIIHCIITYQEYRCLKNVIYQNELLLPTARFRAIWVGFCLNTGKRFFLRGFIFKPT